MTRFGAVLLQPGRAFRDLAAARKPLRTTAWILILTGLLWALTAAGFGLAGASPMAPVLVSLSLENYHFWEMLLVLPLLVCVWLLASLIGKALGLIFGGKGTFRTTAAVLALAWSPPLLFVWLFETTIAVLMLFGLGQQEFVELVSPPGLWQTAFLGYHVVGAAWLWWLNIRALRSAQKLAWWKAALAGTLTALLLAGLFVVFVR